MIINTYQLNNFFNFFLLLFFLNSFLLIDPELIIFFSIAFVIILFVNNLSDIFSKFFNINYINYYYNYIKYFNLQLYNLYELSKYLNLNLFIYNFPFYLEYFSYFKNFIHQFFSFNFKKWLNLLEYNYFKLIKRTQIRLFKFYFNYYFLIIDQIFYLFPRSNLNDSTLLLDYFFQNTTFVGPKKKSDLNLAYHDNPASRFRNISYLNQISSLDANDTTSVNYNNFIENLILKNFKAPHFLKINSNDFINFHKRFNKFFEEYNCRFPLIQLLNRHLLSYSKSKDVDTAKPSQGFFAGVVDKLLKSFF